MDRHEDQTQVKRVVLPSGKTIEVVYFREATELLPATEPGQDLHLCVSCESKLVYPVAWEESGPQNWRVELYCPNCQVSREGTFGQATVEAFDDELDRGTDALRRDYKRLMRANMAEEIDRFAAALQADAVLPEDF
jgi:hypothetical protein